MTSVEQHLARLLALAGPTVPVTLPLEGCRGLVLAEDVIARVPVPVFDNSAMDGFAVRSADLPSPFPEAGVELRVTGESAAGDPPAPAGGPGTAIRIMTGAPLPAGYDQVVPVELTDAPAGISDLPARVRIHRHPARHHIRRAGEDAERGQPVLRGGTRLTPAAIAAAAAVGHGELRVHRRPRVAVLATGSELVDAGGELAPGRIPDSNSPMLAALTAEAGAEVIRRGHVTDRPQELADALHDALDADLVITSGGVSVGAHDVLHTLEAPLNRALEAGVEFDAVAMQPGKPQGWGSLRDERGRSAMLLALPGNPVAAFVSFHLFGRPVLDALAGTTAPVPPVTAYAGDRFTSAPGKRRLIPVTLAAEPDGRRAYATGAGSGSGSHLIASLHRADALAVLDEETDLVQPGELIQAIPIR